MTYKVEGYKLNGYNATYDKAVYDVRERFSGEENCVLEITELNSGVTFVLELEKESRIYEQFSKADAKKVRTGTWKQRPVKSDDRDTEQQGLEKGVCRPVVTFGSKGWHQQLMYDSKRYD